MATLESYTTSIANKENPKIHGLILLGVDKQGKEIYNKVIGYSSLGSDAKPLTRDAVLKLASTTKLFTSIAVLQCVERGLIGLDDPVDKVVPELKDLEIVTWKDEAAKTIEVTKAKNPITPRHLVTHSSGFTYEGANPLIKTWRESRGEEPQMMKRDIPHSFNYPLLFEPGQGWVYGPSLDWAGLMVRRLNDMSLEQYFADNIFGRVGRKAPFPTFDLSKHPDYEARLMECIQPQADGSLKPHVSAFAISPADEFGGHGLAATADDIVAVLADIISDEPKLLNHESIIALYTPQFIPGTPVLEGLKKNSSVYKWFALGEKGTELKFNHALGGLFMQDEMPEYGQPPNVLTWSGATNLVWFVNREKGIAGFFGTQALPPGEAGVQEVVKAWRKDFWTSLAKSP
jgi:CubicO group peptidase (beta-lactamase class C family)